MIMRMAIMEMMLVVVSKVKVRVAEMVTNEGQGKVVSHNLGPTTYEE